MQIPVLIEVVKNNGFRATTGQPMVLTGEGATREEALHQLQRALAERLSAGAEIAPLEFPVPDHPLAPFAGMFQDNPLFDAWQEAISQTRRQADGETEEP